LSGAPGVCTHERDLAALDDDPFLCETTSSPEIGFPPGECARSSDPESEIEEDEEEDEDVGGGGGGERGDDDGFGEDGEMVFGEKVLDARKRGN